jgi:hypothetical protein
MSSRRDFLEAWIVVALAQQSLTQIKKLQKRGRLTGSHEP